MFEFGLNSSIKPVSYTHLDVYKRQACTLYAEPVWRKKRLEFAALEERRSENDVRPSISKRAIIRYSILASHG